MGMSIDEAINHGQEQLEIFGGEHREFIETAIDTMRKYQKIQEIINNAKDSDDAIRFNWLYEQIREVIEDGKVDRCR